MGVRFVVAVAPTQQVDVLPSNWSLRPHQFATGSPTSARKHTGQAPESSSRLKLHAPFVPCVFETGGPFSESYHLLLGFVHFWGSQAPDEVRSSEGRGFPSVARDLSMCCAQAMHI